MDRQRFPGGMCRLWHPASSAGWWLCSLCHPSTAHLPVFQTRLTRTPGKVELLLQGTVQREHCPPCALLMPWGCYSGFYSLVSPWDTRTGQAVLHHVPSSGVAALERALDHNLPCPPSSITTNLFLHPVPTYQICSHPINQPSPVSCMEGWYLRSLLHHNALRHNYTPWKCTQHLLHHETCTKSMIREG